MLLYKSNTKNINGVTTGCNGQLFIYVITLKILRISKNFFMGHYFFIFLIISKYNNNKYKIRQEKRKTCQIIYYQKTSVWKQIILIYLFILKTYIKNICMC